MQPIDIVLIWDQATGLRRGPDAQYMRQTGDALPAVEPLREAFPIVHFVIGGQQFIEDAAAAVALRFPGEGIEQPHELLAHVQADARAGVAIAHFPQIPAEHHLVAHALLAEDHDVARSERGSIPVRNLIELRERLALTAPIFVVEPTFCPAPLEQIQFRPGVAEIGARREQHKCFVEDFAFPRIHITLASVPGQHVIRAIVKASGLLAGFNRAPRKPITLIEAFLMVSHDRHVDEGVIFLRNQPHHAVEMRGRLFVLAESHRDPAEEGFGLDGAPVRFCGEGERLGGVR